MSKHILRELFIPGAGALQLLDTLPELDGGAVAVEFEDGRSPMAAQSAP